MAIHQFKRKKNRIQHIKWKCCLKHKCFVDCGSGNQILLEKAVHIHMRKGSENQNESWIATDKFKQIIQQTNNNKID